MRKKDYERAKEILADFRSEAAHITTSEDELTRAALAAEAPKETALSHKNGSLLAIRIVLGVIAACLVAIFIVIRVLKLEV